MFNSQYDDQKPRIELLPAYMRANIVLEYSDDFEKSYKYHAKWSTSKLNKALAPDEMLIQTFACGVNPVDFKSANGSLKLFFPLKFPASTLHVRSNYYLFAIYLTMYSLAIILFILNESSMFASLLLTQSLVKTFVVKSLQ